MPVDVPVVKMPIRLIDLHVDYVIASSGGPPPLLPDEYAPIQLIHLILIGLLIVLILDLIIDSSYLLSLILFIDVLIFIALFILLLILIIHYLHLMLDLKIVIILITVSLACRDLILILIVLSKLARQRQVLHASCPHDLVTDDLHVLVLLELSGQLSFLLLLLLGR